MENIGLEVGDVVMCTVEKIAGTVVFVKIDENGEGSIVLSEIAPGRIRNLRDYVIPKKRIICKCIRCREIGRNIKKGKVRLKVLEYEASKGKEFFISLEDDNSLYGFCRLRFPSEFLRKEITKDSAFIRELHIYSTALKVGSKGEGFQHKGYGKMLMEKAEEICRKNGKRKLIVVSGVGVKDYYISKLGYERDGAYVSKKITE